VGLMVTLVLPLSLAGPSTGGGQGSTDVQHHHHPPSSATHGEAAKPSDLPPAQKAEERLRLEDLERMALESNPTLAQAAANVRAAEGRRLQARLYTNPTIGATGDKNTPGPIIRGGEYGFFVEQRFVAAGKLAKSRNIAEQERVEADVAAQAQRYRVLNGVRALYYEALGAERMVHMQTQLAKKK